MKHLISSIHKKHSLSLIFIIMSVIVVMTGRFAISSHLDTWGWIDIISAFFLVLAVFFSFSLLGRVAGTVGIFSFFLALLLLAIINGWCYQFFRSYLSFSMVALTYEVRWLKFSVGAIYKAAPIILALLPLPFLWNALFKARRPRRHAAAIGVLASVLCVFVFQWAHAKRPQKFFSPSSENFAMYLLREGIQELNQSIFGPDDSTSERITEVTTQIHRLYPPHTQSYKQVDKDYPLYVAPKETTTEMTEKPNVILVVLESFRASEMGIYGSKVSASPFLDKLSKKGIFAKHFYGNSNQTPRAEFALLCGVPDSHTGVPFSMTSPFSFRGPCLPKILQKYGYETHWFHANTRQGFARYRFLPALGIQKLHSRAQMMRYFRGKRPKKVGWGLADTELFTYTLDTLEKAKKPFFAEVLTLSNHYPFKWNWGIPLPDKIAKGKDGILSDYRRGIYYTDHALSKFWKAFKRSKLAKNTIVAFVADHGIWTFDSSSEKSLSDIAKHERYFRLPFIAVGPGIEPQVIETAVSQVDVAPTLLSILGIETPQAFLGRSFWTQDAKGKTNPQPPKRPIFTVLDGAYGYRFGPIRCVPAQQTCFKDMFPRCTGETKPVADRLCISTEADLLTQPTTKHNSRVVSNRLLRPIDKVFKYLKTNLEKGGYSPPSTVSR